MASACARSIYVNAWLLAFAIYLALAYAFWFYRQYVGTRLWLILPCKLVQDIKKS